MSPAYIDSNRKLLFLLVLSSNFDPELLFELYSGANLSRHLCMPCLRQIFKTRSLASQYVSCKISTYVIYSLTLMFPLIRDATFFVIENVLNPV